MSKGFPELINLFGSYICCKSKYVFKLGRFGIKILMAQFCSKI